MRTLSKWIYFRLLPLYFPTNRRFKSGFQLAIWCCIDCRKSSNLLEVVKGTRIMLRKNHKTILVIKKGEIE
jgi:hypothetical protein